MSTNGVMIVVEKLLLGEIQDKVEFLPLSKHGTLFSCSCECVCVCVCVSACVSVSVSVCVEKGNVHV